MYRPAMQILLYMHFFVMYINVKRCTYVYTPCTHTPQAQAYGSTEGGLTMEVIDDCVRDMLEQHSQKDFWDKGTLDKS